MSKVQQLIMYSKKYFSKFQISVVVNQEDSGHTIYYRTFLLYFFKLQFYFAFKLRHWAINADELYHGIINMIQIFYKLERIWSEGFS